MKSIWNWNTVGLGTQDVLGVEHMVDVVEYWNKSEAFCVRRKAMGCWYHWIAWIGYGFLGLIGHAHVFLRVYDALNDELDDVSEPENEFDLLDSLNGLNEGLHERSDESLAIIDRFEESEQYSTPAGSCLANVEA